MVDKVQQPKKFNFSAPTALPQEAIVEFKDLYLKRYDIQLSDEEASFRANNLVGLYEAVYSRSPRQIMPMEKIKR